MPILLIALSSIAQLPDKPLGTGVVLEALGLDSATAVALTVVAIGAGAMVVSHTNDSYFWVVTRSPTCRRRSATDCKRSALVQGLVAIAAAVL